MTANSKSSTSKSTGRALLASFLALLLCFSTLLGTTFAWFTDSASTGVNKIQAGNLDVNLYSTTNGSDWSLVKSASEDTDSQTGTVLFGSIGNGTLWEPGHTEVAYVKVSNEGTLAMVYSLSIAVKNNSSYTNVSGETVQLSSFVNVGIVELNPTSTGSDAAVINEDDGDSSSTVSSDDSISIYSSREDALSAVSSSGLVKNVTTLVENSSENPLTSKQSKYYAIVVWMPTTVGNEANPASGQQPAIEFKLNVSAKQVSYEADSYGDTYDSNAEWATYAVTESDKSWYDNADANSSSDGSATSYSISTAGELLSLASIVNDGTDSFSGKTITLANDINLPAGTQWTPIGTASNPFNGTFDGNGYTISNLTMNGNDGNGPAGLFGFIDSAKITHVIVSGSITLADINTAGKDSKYVSAGGICGYATNSEIEKCTNRININTIGRTTQEGSDVLYVGGILGFGENSTKINNCLNEGNITGKYDESHSQAIGGIVGIYGGSGANKFVALSNCVNAGSITSSSETEYAGALIGIINYCPTDVSNCYSVLGNQLCYGIPGEATFDDLSFTWPETVKYVSPASSLSDFPGLSSDVWEFSVASGHPVLK